jgi:hypothetical protein
MGLNGVVSLRCDGLIVVERDGADVTRSHVEGLGRFATAARDLRLGWRRFPDDAEVIHLFDKGDACFGYAFNLDWPDGSEWGYAPFGESTPHDAVAGHRNTAA